MGETIAATTPCRPCPLELLPLKLPEPLPILLLNLFQRRHLCLLSSTAPISPDSGCVAGSVLSYWNCCRGQAEEKNEELSADGTSKSGKRHVKRSTWGEVVAEHIKIDMHEHEG
ncbi:hypothetical protein Ahy_A08g040407 isoform E [Arachis hypogaea]|uniref:Uncharacterized protein n=1 Tax=Arachis hypogaea TaxID=3818 RepID=A0A445BZ45_ARAHY|nr:hypothetical protein Ahy_A08g040407 isoform A [Arachis hypogaea]RYR44024.1 hypothetical protein Ahy_A08g040407 isoform B [Arachis hypogaea]RYR44025.1 hypothetical protein Ahy_A08g040407 isoform C [Arachis hypogaea]RYR44026.1 hypothetical protein Ahy_A08g040407 isoform E [Arachis hypogaea]